MKIIYSYKTSKFKNNLKQLLTTYLINIETDNFSLYSL